MTITRSIPSSAAAVFLPPRWHWVSLPVDLPRPTPEKPGPPGPRPLPRSRRWMPRRHPTTSPTSPAASPAGTAMNNHTTRKENDMPLFMDVHHIDGESPSTTSQAPTRRISRSSPTTT